MFEELLSAEGSGCGAWTSSLEDSLGAVEETKERNFERNVIVVQFPLPIIAICLLVNAEDDVVDNYEVIIIRATT